MLHNALTTALLPSAYHNKLQPRTSNPFLSQPTRPPSPTSNSSRYHKQLPTLYRHIKSSKAPRIPRRAAGDYDSATSSASPNMSCSFMLFCTSSAINSSYSSRLRWMCNLNRTISSSMRSISVCSSSRSALARRVSCSYLFLPSAFSFYSWRRSLEGKKRTGPLTQC